MLILESNSLQINTLSLPLLCILVDYTRVKFFSINYFIFSVILQYNNIFESYIYPSFSKKITEKKIRKKVSDLSHPSLSIFLLSILAGIFGSLSSGQPGKETQNIFGKMESRKCMNEVCGQGLSMGFKDGWELNSGAFAVLCVPCGVAYEDSIYCIAFHTEQSGWRECKFCNVPIHCGCIVSKNLHERLDFGGVGCNNCLNDIELRLATAIPPSILSRPASSNARISISNLLDSVTRESPDIPNNAPTHSNNTENTARHFTDQTALGAERNRLQNPRIKPKYMPQITEQKLEQLSKILGSNIVPLFQKKLSATDTKVGRLCLPKACAEAFFPAIEEDVQIPIKDMDGTNWEFRFWFSLPDLYRDRTYYLDIKPCLPYLQLHAGDIVTFCRMEENQQLVISYPGSTDTRDFPVDREYEQDPSLRPSSSRAITDVLSDSSGKFSESEEDDEIPARKRARRSRESMVLEISWQEGQELLRPPINCNYTVVMVDGNEIDEYDDPPVIGAEPTRVDSGTEPTPAATSSHRKRRSRRKQRKPRRGYRVYHDQPEESPGSAELAVGPSSSNVRMFDLNDEIQSKDGLEYSD